MATNIPRNVETLAKLQSILVSLPDGTTCDVLSSDLEAGNFETAHFVQNGIDHQFLSYSGPVAEGYVSPFETDIED
jgi:hypothetical protein